jgi:predicted HTH domain antitoxin
MVSEINSINRYRRGEVSLWAAARDAGCSLEEFKEILRSRGVAIRIASKKQESDARLKRFFNA